MQEGVQVLPSFGKFHGKKNLLSLEVNSVFHCGTKDNLGAF